MSPRTLTSDDRRFLSALAASRVAEFSTRDLAALITQYPPIREALPLSLASKVGAPTFTVVLGKALAKRVDTPYGKLDDIRLVRAGMDRTKTQYWRIVTGITANGCECARPIAVDDEGELRCWRCGHEVIA